MDKKSGILVICAAILVLCFVGTASARIWYVDDDGGADFTWIQDTINNATDGDTIIVRDGTYIENVDVNKRLTIRSENGPTYTIVQTANSSDHVFEVTANYVNISGLTIKSAKNLIFPPVGGIGIYLYYADYCNISNNICIPKDSASYHRAEGILLIDSNKNHISNNTCSYNDDGILLINSNNNSIFNNICSDNSNGISLGYSNNNSISNNTCSDNWYIMYARGGDGIRLWDSNNNSISNNTCSYNEDNGIHFINSSNNSISNNNCSDNYVGIYLCWGSNDNKLKGNVMAGNGIYIRGGSLRDYMHEIEESNMVNGKPIYYWKDIGGGIVSDDAGQVMLINCSNVIVEKMDLSDASVGIEVAFSSNITIKNNTCSDNILDGISLKYSSNNSISNNTCSHDGISFEYSNNNRISNNICSYNYDGISLEYSNNNRISNNTCSYNKYGIHFEHSSNNYISNNTCSNSRYTEIGDCVGIYIWRDSNNNSISNNICSNNRNDGIYIWTSNNNSISDNICSENRYDGISLMYSTSNSISNNNCSNNSQGGISLSYSNGNIVYCNNFINNTAGNVYFYDSTNIWNSTEEITYTYKGATYTNYLGNYWDDYTDVDANTDGIWDHPRSIDPDQDYHPLVAPFENYFVSTPPIFET